MTTWPLFQTVGFTVDLVAVPDHRRYGAEDVMLLAHGAWRADHIPAARAVVDSAGHLPDPDKLEKRLSQLIRQDQKPPLVGTIDRRIHAMSTYMRMDATDHVTVAAALGRLGRQGGWDRLRAGMPLSSVDRVDAELLVAAGLLTRSGTDSFAVAEPDLAPISGDVLANGVATQLRRALAHLDRRDVGWSAVDPELVLSQGRSSRAAAEFIARELLPAMPGSHAAFESGSARFLDVGVGVGAISIRLCQLYDGLHCVGIDVLDEPLKLAAAELDKHGLADRVELRRQSVTDLSDEARYDLGWLPQVFIPRPAFIEGCRRVYAALRPDRWVIIPLAASTANDAFEDAVAAHTAHLLGGGPIDPPEAATVLTIAGYVDCRPTSWRGQAFIVARRPS